MVSFGAFWVVFFYSSAAYFTHKNWCFEASRTCWGTGCS